MPTLSRNNSLTTATLKEKTSQKRKKVRANDIPVPCYIWRVTKKILTHLFLNIHNLIQCLLIYKLLNKKIGTAITATRQQPPHVGINFIVATVANTRASSANHVYVYF